MVAIARSAGITRQVAISVPPTTRARAITPSKRLRRARAVTAKYAAANQQAFASSKTVGRRIERSDWRISHAGNSSARKKDNRQRDSPASQMQKRPAATAPPGEPPNRPREHTDENQRLCHQPMHVRLDEFCVETEIREKQSAER